MSSPDSSVVTLLDISDSVSLSVVKFRKFFLDFWKKTNTYNEQPNIHFKYKLLVTLTLNSPSGDLVTWSTYPNYNQLMMEKLRIPTVKVPIINSFIYS